MTVTAETYTPNETTANGTQYDFDFNFTIHDEDELGIFLNGVEQSSGFELIDPLVEGGGTVRFIDGGSNPNPPDAGIIVRLTRSTDKVQPTVYPYPHENIERSLDKLTHIVQELGNYVLPVEDIDAYVAAAAGSAAAAATSQSEAFDSAAWAEANSISAAAQATAAATSASEAAASAAAADDSFDAKFAGFLSSGAHETIYTDIPSEDLDDLLTNGVYNFNYESLNVPPFTEELNGWGFVRTFLHKAPGYRTQVAYPMNLSEQRMAIRQEISSVWGPWKEVFTQDRPSPYGPGFKNYLINGNMDIWQRGVSFSPTGVLYMADQWCGRRGSLTTGMTVTRQSSAASVNGTYALRMQRDSGDTSADELRVIQPIESISTKHLRGKYVTISCQVRVGANYSSNPGYVHLAYNTAEDPGNNPFVFSAVASIPVYATDTSWSKKSKSVLLPADANSLVAMIRSAPVGTAGADDWIEVTQVQIEEGKYATDFEIRPFAAEVALCERYFQKSYNLINTPGSVTSAGNKAWRNQTSATATYLQPHGVILPVRMRTAPTAVLYSPATGASGVVRNASSGADITASLEYVSETGFGRLVAASAQAANAYGVYHYTLDAAL